MENTIEKNPNRVKLYGVIIGVLSLAAQHGIYLLAHFIAAKLGIEPFYPKIACIDDAIPLIPIFILPYIWSYLYWAMAPMAVSKCDFRHFLDYLASYLTACLFGALILIVAPTYMDRVAEGLYEATGFGSKLMQFWYSLDGSEMAYNLLPSFHCINSMISLLGVWGRKEIPKWYRVYSLVITLLIFASTMFVKQHFFADVVSGILIAVVFFFICKKWHWGRMFDPFINWFRKKYGKKEA